MANEPEPCEQAQLYEFRVKGSLDGDWSDWFGNLQIIVEGGVTCLYGPVSDQAALYGVITTIRNLGLMLLSVNSHPDTANSRADEGISP